MSLDIIDFDASTGTLRTIYERVRARPQSPIYRGARAGVPALLVAHSLDPLLIPKVAEASSTLNDAGPLPWKERAMINAITARLLHSSRQVPECHEPTSLRASVLGQLATLVTLAPWQLTRAHRVRAHEADLDDDDILHAIVLAALAGHLDRIADAVAVPATTPESVPALETAPISITRGPAISVARRPFTATALAAWRTHVFWRDAPLRRRQRTLIARWVALWIGDGGLSHPGDLTLAPLDEGLRALAEEVTLAPWRLSTDSYAPLRRAGVDDATLFDLVALASTAGMLSRIEVALGALGRREG